MPLALRHARTLLACGCLLAVGSCGQPLFPGLMPKSAAATTAPASQATPNEPLAVAPAAEPERPPSPDAPPLAAPALAGPDGSLTVPRAGIVVTTITFDILRVRVPQGLFSQSAKIWNHVDSGFLPASMSATLHRNGLRVARGETSAWPPIRAILETEAKVETAQNRLIVSNGLPLFLELDPTPRDQLLFVYRRDGTLAGAPWRSSRNLLRIDYGISPVHPEAMLFEVVPAIRLDSPAANALRGSEIWDPTVAVDRSLAIRDLAFRVELGPEQFLAIGPSSTTRELPYVMGTLMLCEDKGGEAFESMYFITPTATRNGGPFKPAAGKGDDVVGRTAR